MQNSTNYSIGHLVKRGVRNELLTSVLMLVVGLFFLAAAAEDEEGLTIIFALVLLGGGAYFGWRCFQHFRDRNTHPLLKQLSEYGNVQSLEKSIATECESPLLNTGKTLFTRSWVIDRTTYGANLLRGKDILWAYKKVTSHSVNFIPTGKTYATMIHTAKQTVEVTLPDKRTTELLTEVAKNWPWVVLGYEKDIQNLWNKDRAGFESAVKERVKKHLGSSAIEQTQHERKAHKEKAARFCSSCGKETSSEWKFCKHCGESLI